MLDYWLAIARAGARVHSRAGESSDDASVSSCTAVARKTDQKKQTETETETGTKGRDRDRDKGTRQRHRDETETKGRDRDTGTRCRHRDETETKRRDRRRDKKDEADIDEHTGMHVI